MKKRIFKVTLSYWVDPIGEPKSLTRITNHFFVSKKKALRFYDNLYKNAEHVPDFLMREENNFPFLGITPETFIQGKIHRFMMPESDPENPDYRTAKVVISYSHDLYLF